MKIKITSDLYMRPVPLQPHLFIGYPNKFLFKVRNVVFHWSNKQAICVREWALCQLSLCFELQSTSESRKEYKSCMLQMLFRSSCFEQPV